MILTPLQLDARLMAPTTQISQSPIRHRRPRRTIQLHMTRSTSQCQPLFMAAMATIVPTSLSTIPTTALVPSTLAPNGRPGPITRRHLLTAIVMAQAQNLVGRALSRVPHPPPLRARPLVLDMTSRLQNRNVWAACCTGLVAGFRVLFFAQSFAPGEGSSM
jgi:hypothetical protein